MKSLGSELGLSTFLTNFKIDIFPSKHNDSWKRGCVIYMHLGTRVESQKLCLLDSEVTSNQNRKIVMVTITSPQGQR